jgi:polysaccharide biosynthesis transport protein
MNQGSGPTDDRSVDKNREGMFLPSIRIPAAATWTSDEWSVDSPADRTESRLPQLLGALFRRKWLILGIFAVVLSVSALYALLTKPVYTSKAMLEIDKDMGSSISSLGDAISQAVNSASDNEMFETQKGLLKGRTLAEAMIDKLHLEEHPEFSRKDENSETLFRQFLSMIKSVVPWKESLPNEVEARDSLITNVMERITVKRDGKSRLMIISLDADSPEFAKQMLEEYINLYLADNLLKRRRVNIETGLWLQEELKKAEEKSVKALAEVVEFTKNHAMVSIEPENNHILAFFNKTAEGLIRAKETRFQLEAMRSTGGKVMSVFPREKTQLPDLDALHNKMGLLESEYAQMKTVYSDNYPKMVILRKQIDFLRAKIESVQKDISDSIAETAKAAEYSQEEAFEEARRAALESSSFTVQYAILKKTADTTQEIFNLLLRKSKELQVSTQIIGNNVIAVSQPSLPARPTKPKKTLILLVGCTIGLIGGITAALFAESLDRSIKKVEEIEKLNLKNLGTIPHTRFLNLRKKEMRDLLENGPLSHWHPNSPIVDALENVRTSILLSLPSGYFTSVLVTSPIPNEGKTFSAVSLASVMCSSGARVVIVDADFRKPSIHKMFNQSITPGLSNLLSNGGLGLKKAIHKSKFPGLFCVCAGNEFAHPARLLYSERLPEIVADLKKAFDFIVVDSPPVVGLPDSRILATAVDGVVLVVKQGQSSPEAIRKATNALSSSAKCTILGTIFNGATPLLPYFSRYEAYYL